MNWWQAILTAFGCFYGAAMLIFGIVWLVVHVETKSMEARMRMEMLRMEMELYRDLEL